MKLLYFDRILFTVCTRLREHRRRELIFFKMASNMAAIQQKLPPSYIRLMRVAGDDLQMRVHNHIGCCVDLGNAH